MPSLYDLKPRFRALLRPLVHTLGRRGITPNQLTVAAALLSISGGAWMAQGVRHGETRVLLAAPVLLLVRMALNALDGLMAQELHQKTRLGALLNELGDVVSDAALYAPLAWVPRVPPAWVMAVVVLSVVTEFAGVLGQVLGGARRYDGPMGKADRALVLGALMFVLGMGVPASGWVSTVLGLVSVLLILTVVNRAVAALSSSNVPRE